MNEFLERKKIYDLISRRPGIHSSKIAELLNIKISDVEYHLKYFLKERIIIISKKEGYKRYYIEEKIFKTRDKRALETKRIISKLISQNPGLHLSKIAKMLDMSIPLTDYHLLHMEKDGEINAVKDEKGYYKRYYLAGVGIKGQEKTILRLLSRKVPLTIVFVLLKHHNVRHKEILKYVHITSSTLSYHLTKLVDSGIVDINPYGKEKGYVLKDRDEIVRILKKYDLHVELSVVIESFKDLWDDLDYGSMG